MWSNEPATPDRTLAERVDQPVRRETTIQNYEELFAEAEELLLLIIHTRKSMKENRQSRLAAEIKEISGNYVFKLFRKFYGTTFQRYVETVRMEHAQTRLSVSASEYRRQAACGMIRARAVRLQVRA